MRFMQGVFLLCLCLLIAFGACRRNQPSLVDRNEPPDTKLWYSPPDSTDYEYLVHMYWRGEDRDGTAVRFIWTIQDTLIDVFDPQSWNPASRLSDFRSGRMTSRTDSVFSFTAFQASGSIGVKRNRQAFYIAAIDDNGVIDPTPAAVEFIATIEELPWTSFTTHISGVSKPYRVLDTPEDTVGVFTPFEISYNGHTTNGLVRAFIFYPLTTGVFLDGQNEWIEGVEVQEGDSVYVHFEVEDTLQSIENSPSDMVPSGVFKFAAACRDDANAESSIDAGRFTQGVCKIVVNYDPDTAINKLHSTYIIDGVVHEEYIEEIGDGIPDTVPYRSWARLEYSGWDDKRDGKIACGPHAPDSCIGFQVAYFQESVFNPALSEFSLWQPREGVHDSDCESSTDSNTFHIGSLEYDLFVRAVDEHERPDGTPPSVHLIGNFDPTLDSLAVEDHLGNRIDLSIVDTITWNFWKGEGWPYECVCDTVLKPEGLCAEANPICAFKDYPEHGLSFDYYKRFSVHIKAWGHDHPKDPTPSDPNRPETGSGVKSWEYSVQNSQGQFVNLGKANKGFFDEVDGVSQFNVLDDVLLWRVFYPGEFSDNPDPTGDTVFANLPRWMGEELTVVVRGRDTPKRTPQGQQFNQFILMRYGCDADLVENVINVFPDASLGRRTQPEGFAFRIEIVR